MDGLESSSPTRKEQGAGPTTVSEETLKAALRVGGRRILDKIEPDFIELMRSAPNVKGGTADIIHRAMEKYKVTTEEVCSLIVIYSVLDKVKIKQNEQLLVTMSQKVKALEEELELAKDERSKAIRTLEEMCVQKKQMVPSNEFRQLQIEHQKLRESLTDIELRGKNEEYRKECLSLREENARLKARLKEAQETASQNYLDKEKYRTRAKEMQVRINRLEDIIHRLQQSLKSVYDQVAPLRYQLPQERGREHQRLKQYGRPYSDPNIQVGGAARYITDTRKPFQPHDLVTRDVAHHLGDPHTSYHPREERVAGSFKPSPLTSVMPSLDQDQGPPENPPMFKEMQDGPLVAVTTRGKFPGETENDTQLSNRGEIQTCPICNEHVVRDIGLDVDHIASCKLAVWKEDDDVTA